MLQDRNTTQALILTEDLEPWLAEHGVEMRYTRDATINIGADSRGARVWLEVEFYKLDENGKMYVQPGTHEAAMGRISVPIKSWPPLNRVKTDAEVLADDIANEPGGEGFKPVGQSTDG